MSKNLLKTKSALFIALLVLGAAVLPLLGSEHHGTVKFGGLPLPGATVTAKQGDKSFGAITDLEGRYSFADLPDGSWTIQVEMPLFAPLQQDVTVAASAAAAEWDLKLLPAEQINAMVTPASPRLQVAETPTPSAAPPKPPRNGKAAPAPTNTTTAFQRTDLNAAPAANNNSPAPAADSGVPQDASALSQRAADGLLINGSVNNGASSPFAQLQAFGNNRRGVRSLYNGNLGFSLRNSSLDARTFSLTGQDTPKPGYNQMQGLASFGGPVKIPGLIKRNGPNFNVNYQWTHNRNASTTPGLMPTPAMRTGDFSGTPFIVRDPNTGVAFPGNVIPVERISPEARALLNLYPLPNFVGRYNYQIPLIGGTHQDSLQARMNKQVKKNQFSGTFGLQSTRTDNTNLLGFLDTGRTLGMNLQLGWRHQFTPRAFVNVGYQFSRFSSENIPFFAHRENISGLAGITGNNQEPVNYGPPGLSFASGITALSDAQYSAIHNQNNGVSVDALWNRGRHNVTYGTSFRRLQLNSIGQQEPRGTFTFTGLAAGSDFGGFLLGVPDTSSIAFGNADKYFRSSNYDAFVTDDWRMRSGFTLNVGVRWDYGSPITELYGRLVNLDVAPGFAAVTPVLGQSPTGALTQQSYPSSLVHPDKNNIAPRIGISWRPFSASSMVVRAGYGVYYDTSVYQSIASQMAQQSPLSKSLRVQNGPDTPLTLKNGFIGSPNITANSFAIDPNFRVGYAQNWQASVERDLPAALQMVATYLGVKGTRAQQQFLPNTFAPGALNPCPTCPSGFTYLTSNGNSMRHAALIQLRRRLRSGFTAELQYTFSKSIDDALLGGGQGAVIAQDWLNLRGERALSNFDQRHLLSLQMQYTSGMGLHGGSLLGGWRGTLLKEWTASTQVTAGTGRPLTPVYQGVVPGTGVAGIRPDYTGASLYDAPSGLFLNPAAYVAPPAGHWGNAGRNTITGPQQFTMNASMARTFRLSDRYSADLRIDAANALNHPVYSSWVTTISSAQFGLPTFANPMRSVQTTVRVRF
ncbi:MAG: carboxypeptidase-like regulatory domain-containing protein [Acidobacteriia bacterium]|nr:carboxypeptidase-like regulatory domain-containing protein [Terriglobia bacterium]